MITNNVTVYLMQRTKTSAFATINAKILGSEPYRLGSSTKAVAKMLVNGDELKVLMPQILSLDPRTTSGKWDELVNNYWHSLSVDVYPEGVKLEVGFVYDATDSTTFFDGTKRKDHIKELFTKYPKKVTEGKNISDDEHLMSLLKSDAVREDEKYKYARPIEPKDYLLYRYCLGFREVANDIKDVDNSPNIRFYLFNEGQAEEIRKKEFKLKKTAMELYLKTIQDSESVNNILYALKRDIRDEDDIAKHMMLDDICKKNPQDFINTVNDKTLKTKALVERYIFAGLLKRMPHSNIIVDGKSPEVVIGNDIDEAIIWFNNEKNKAEISHYESQFKGLKK